MTKIHFKEDTMPVLEVRKDTDALSITIISEFAAEPGRVWQLFADPRQLERWFGPPTYPATFTEHSLTPGSRSSYYMTSPEGRRFGGWWEVESVEEPDQFTYRDGFADGEGNPVDGPVSRNVVRLGAHQGATRVVMVSTYETSEDMAKVLEMGVEEGATSAINQIDAILAGVAVGE